MSTLLWIFLWLGGLIALAYHRVSFIGATIAVGLGLLATTFFSSASWLSLLILWLLFGGIALVINHPDYRRKCLIEPAFKKMRRATPTLSKTERIALEAGTVSWEAELFSGTLQWEKLLTIATPKLTAEEKDFLDGPVMSLCEMVDDWEITHKTFDLPDNVWKFLKDQGFFGLVIPKKYGGKGFSEFAHSEILTVLAGRSLTLSSIVAVPNSLGPAELLLRYGTQAQRDHYLPRLSTGKEIPCFALTGPEAGSDAGAITDKGIVCKGFFEGKEILGIKLNWNKRYITLAPVATLLGLAFKLYDPERLLGEEKEYGITCALIPTNLPGITIGRRHLPCNIPFQNGPTQGQDVFIPLDWIIGGQNMVGQGWRMLMECLSIGRAISLPSSGVGGAKIAALTTGAYSLIRRQFRTSLASFEGVQEVLARIGAHTYACEAVRSLTVAMIQAGERPSVPGAISKYHVTEMARQISLDAMDIHAGKGVMLGPKNYLARAYQGAPIAITVEGANILTRSMIIFGQGAIRCHPYLLKEMEALAHQNLPDFEHALNEHISHTLSNAARAFFHGLTLSKFAGSPISTAAKPFYQQLARASNAFALVTDATMAMLGGKLKFREGLSGKLADMLSMMYIISAILKRYQDQGSPQADFALVAWSVENCLAKFWTSMAALLRELPQRQVAFGLRFLVMPWGIPCQGPKASLNLEITKILTTPNEARTRLLGNIFISSNEKDSITELEHAFQEMAQHPVLLKRVFDAIKHNDAVQSLEEGIELALQAKIITENEAITLRNLESLYQAVINVDDFSAEELTCKTDAKLEEVVM